MLGDDRKGVGLDADGLPDIDWVRIVPPKGNAYSIARYPVTNAQFDAFVQDDGYTATWDACWTKAGLAWRQSNPEPKGLSHPFPLPNHPRVEVTLHEAVAFANWLGARRKSKKGAIRLPTSSEWQFAAQGATKRKWAWGDDYGDGTRSNGRDAGIGSMCAVGIFPQGATPELRLHDMSGNVLNWAVRAEDPRAEATGSVWGGSWLFGADGLRADVGGDGGADGRYDDLGFRLAAPASL
jgi:formylglycine-generating enzyme required for sulfatase activity